MEVTCERVALNHKYEVNVEEYLLQRQLSPTARWYVEFIEVFEVVDRISASKDVQVVAD